MYDHARARLAVFDTLVDALREADRAYSRLQKLLVSMDGHPSTIAITEAIAHLTNTRRAVTTALLSVEAGVPLALGPTGNHLKGAEKDIKLLLPGETQD